MPQPAPFVEIYVYSPDVEGIHLRGGADRPRRPALVGPPGLPHRGLRADARAGDQERRDRARGREGRLLHQARRRRAAPLRHVHPLAAVGHRQPGRRARRAAAVRARRATATTPTWSSRPTRARRRSRTSRTGSRTSTASGSTTRSPPAARRATTTRRSGSRPRAPGSRSSATSRSSGSTRRPTSSPSSGSATCPATCSATGCCCRSRSGSSRPTTTGTCSSTRTPDRGGRLRGAPAAVRAAALVVGRLRPRADLRGRRRVPAQREVDPAVAAGARGARRSPRSRCRRPR